MGKAEVRVRVVSFHSTPHFKHMVSNDMFRTGLAKIYRQKGVKP